jgi:hypothetical protein
LIEPILAVDGPKVRLAGSYYPGVLLSLAESKELLRLNQMLFLSRFPDDQAFWRKFPGRMCELWRKFPGRM